MSQRAKRPNRFDDGNVPVKRRKRPTAQEEEEASALGWRPINDLKIYNRATTEAPAELFRKDLISAMKLPDSEPLASNEYWLIVDQWKQEWERGVQVPVNPDSLPEPSVTVTHCATVHIKPLQEYKPPKTRYIRITKDDRFKPEEHYLSTAPAQAEAACSYDLDECDVAWLRLQNADRLAMGLSPISEDQLERVIERYEVRCWDRIQAILRNEEGLGIEYDENVICDVCRSPDSEEGNEMVFCDACNICVHQACYGITRIPEGQWLCCTCAIKQRPDCVLCPNKGGAMKSTRSGQKWAHVSCALWIPEVSIGCVERMEPITKISSIPASRWALICVLCRERVGACIQCSVKTCKTAYHVTCAFKHGLEMRAIIEDENADDGVKLRSYCEKHSKSGKKDSGRGGGGGGGGGAACSGSEEEDCKRKKRKDMTSEEKNQARAARQAEIEAEFHKHVAVKDVVAACIDVDAEALAAVYSYWKLKRRAGHNRPLLPPKYEDVDLLSHKQEQADLERMKMIVQLRQDLERVRNLCYMVSRREKLSRSYFKMRESTFQKQVAVLLCPNLSPKVTDAVVAANRGPNIYDRVYSNAEDVTINIESMIARITGCKSPAPDSADERKPEINGLFKDVKNNPYKKLYFNGSSKRRSASLCSSLTSSEDSSDEKRLPKPRHNKENRLHSSTDDEKPVIKKSPPVKPGKAERRRKRFSISRALDSSSEDDDKGGEAVKKEANTSNSRLKQMEKELVGISASDSDELMMMPIKTSSPRSSPNKKAMSSIYSDSDSSDSSTRNDASDSQSQSKMRTKAAMKDFSHKQLNKSPNKSSPENKKKTKDEKDKDKEDVALKEKEKERPKKDTKKKDYVPSDLIVPQRQAAKKATENLKSTTATRAKEVPSDVDVKQDSEKEKEKPPSATTTTTKPKKLGRPPKDKDKDNKDKEEKKPKDSKETRVLKEAREKDEKKDKEKEKDKDDIIDSDKELDKTDLDILAYVPQRQAAKKAAEHIKGLGNKLPTGSDAPEDKKSSSKEEDKSPEKTSKKEERKKDDKPPAAKVADKRKSSTNSSSSSSSSSTSSSSSATSSSESDSDSPRKKPSQADTATKSSTERLAAPTSTTGGRRSGAKDWPFLDKAAKPAASSSSSSESSDSEAPRSSSAAAPSKGRAASKSPTLPRTPNKSGRKSAVCSDKKSPVAAPEREKSGRPRGRPPGRGRARGSPASASAGAIITPIAVAKSSSNDRVAANVRHGDLTERTESNTKVRKGKSTDVEEQPEATIVDITAAPEIKRNSSPEKSDTKQASVDSNSVGKKGKLFSPISSDNKVAEPEKKIKSPLPALSHAGNVRDSEQENDEPLEEPEATDLEKEIMERKAASNKTTTKSKFDRMFFDSKEKEKEKVNKEKPSKSPVKENKEPLGVHAKQAIPTKKSPSKAVKSLDDIFANKLSNTLNAKSPSNEKVLSSAKHEDDIFKLEEDKSRNYQNTHSNDDLLDDIDDIFEDDFGISSKDEDIIKLPLTFNFAGSLVLREDSKEDSARETLNLVEKLRGNMGLTKKSTSIDIDDAISIASSKPEDRVDSDQSVPQMVDEKPDEKDLLPSQHPQINLQVAITTKYEEKEYKFGRTDAHTEDKSVPDMQQHTEGAAQADERWVPPSEYAPPPIENKPAPTMHDDLITSHAKSQSPMSDRRQVHQIRTPFLDAASSLDCIPSPMPYNDLHPQGKWAEANLMPNRRSSSSSIASSASNMSRRNNDDEELLKRHELPAAHPTMDVINNLPNLLPQPNLLQFPPNALDVGFQQFANEANHFVGNPVSLFPPTNTSTQLPFPSPGAAMFPPPFGTGFSTPLSVMPSLNKPTEEMNIPQTAAFTSSQANMALTAAMVNMTHAFAPSSKTEVDDGMDILRGMGTVPEVPISDLHQESKEEPSMVQAQAQTPIPVPDASPALSNSTPNHVEPSPNPSVKSNSSSGKKSPSKPTRTSARFISQQQHEKEKKSPSKSPGKSPRQDLKASSTGKKEKKVGKGSSGRGAQSQNRGRGRGRGRGRPPNPAIHHNEFAFDPNTIHNKLVGTVYDLDFDDDMNECGDLRAMRERRKSSDPHDARKGDSPKFTSPSHKNRYHLSDLRPPTPISDTQSSLSKPASPEPPTEPEKAFPTVVPPVMPGPVDMRTYSSTLETSTYQENSLMQFNSSIIPSVDLTVQEHEQELEEFDKELQNSLAKNSQPEEPAVPEVNKIKVSLSDSRNQLKVKIKGPLGNYTSSSYTSTVTPLPPVSDVNTNAHSHYTNSISNSINSTPVSTNSGAGVTNLHRMRKKELLRQYCSQGMNTNDPLNSTSGVSTPVTPSLNRTIITIPKAVASMTSIPTKDDYRDYRTGNDEIFETKIRKEKPKSGLRELRQLDLPFGPLSLMGNVDDDNAMERRRSIGSNNGTTMTEKRRGRPPRNASNAGGAQQTAPKLKIKIGANSIMSSANIEPVGMHDGKIDDRRDRIRPPKKRLSASVAKPSVEDLKRESMKFRKQVMADFGGMSEKKEKKKKNKDKDKDKSSRKSKKKKKQDMQIVAPSTTDATTTKLIIRLRKNDDTTVAPAPPPSTTTTAQNKTECAEIRDNERAGERTEGKSGADVLKVCANKADVRNAALGVGAKSDVCNERTSGSVASSAINDRDGLCPIVTIKPIKLKLARCQEGYMMKTHANTSGAVVTTDGAGAPGPVPASATLNLHETTPPPPVHAPPNPLPLNKDCEVR